jgi:outer membrane biosynthesis protein TonB
MSDEFNEDFVVEEGEAAGATEAAGRTFLILAGSLIGIFIIIAACILGVALVQRNQQADEIAQREAENATIIAQNALVTQTVQAQQTEAARPTNTPLPSPTPLPTSTPLPPTVEPTDTPVVAVESVRQTEEAQQTAAAEQTATGVAIAAALQTPTSTPVAAAGGDGSGQLPATGLSTWTLVVAALGFFGLLFLARRLRTS